jgi:hypothetical protein
MMRKFFLSIALLLVLATAANAGWSEPVRISEPGGGYNPQIIAQGDTLHVIYTLTSAREGVFYLRSSNRGQTWGEQKILSDTINTGPAWYPRIMVNGNRILALWEIYIAHPVYHYNIAYSISNNDGLTWSTPQYVLSTNRQWGFPMAASAAGSIVNIVAECSVVNDTVYNSNIRSTNFGQSWSSPQEMFRTLQSGIPDQASKGNFVHFIWDGCNQLSDPWETYYLRSTDGGLSWSQSAMISTQDNHGSEIPAIGIDNNGYLALCWTDGKYSPYMATGDILGRTSIDSGSTWGPEWQASFDHFAWGSDIALNSDTIHIVWTDEGPGIIHRSIYYTRSTDNGAAWSEPYWIDGTLDDSHDPATATSNSRVYVIWYDCQRPDTSGLYFSRYDPEPDAVDAENIKLTEMTSLSAHPNPFNSSVLISVEAPESGVLSIYDITGREIWRYNIACGMQQVRWEAKDGVGKNVASGVYLARVQGRDGQAAQVKLVYLK